MNSSQVESADSAVVSKAITSASASKSVTVTITGTTPPPQSLKTNATIAYDTVRVNNVRTLGQKVGTIAIGKACDSTYKVGTTYYRVTTTDVTVTTTPRSRGYAAS